MLIHTIESRFFRNLASQTLNPGPRFNVLCGDNAQGKTNFLESIYLVACLRSFRAHRSRELLRFGEREAVVRAAVQAGGMRRELEVRLQEGGRHARVDGKGVRSSAGYLSRGLNVVLFTPDDVQVPRGSPAQRRQLLDRAIANLWPAYTGLHRDYHKTLQSRNRVLRDGGRESLIDVYGDQLCEQGARLVLARQRYLTAVAPRMQQVFDEISHSGVVASLHHVTQPSVLEATLGNQEQVRQAMRAVMRQQLATDRARQSTSVGPHADDLDFRLDGRSARQVGSQGQHRALLLSFKVAQIVDTHQRVGEYPVLLLDDVSSELDAQRNGYLFDFINKIPCQAFLTTTRVELLPMGDDRNDFQVVDGVVRAAN